MNRSVSASRTRSPAVGPYTVLTHRDCGALVHQRLSCDAGHELDSPREITTVPGPGARRIA